MRPKPRGAGHASKLRGPAAAQGDRMPLPARTSKWNRDRTPTVLVDRPQLEGGQPAGQVWETVVNLIGARRTRAWLQVKAAADSRNYETAVKIPDQDMERLKVQLHRSHPGWNCTVAPGSNGKSKPRFVATLAPQQPGAGEAGAARGAGGEPQPRGVLRRRAPRSGAGGQAQHRPVPADVTFQLNAGMRFET